MEPSASPLLYRKNGRAQACEPCRKRKMACDHTQPVCNRCRRGKRIEACEYIVTGSSRKARYRSPPRSNDSSVEHQPPSRATSPSRLTRSTGTSSHASTSFRTAPPGTIIAHEATSPSTADPGYLGFTSFSSVFDETRSSLSLLWPSNSAQLSSDCSPEQASSATSPFRNLPRRTLETCLYVLKNVPEKHKAQVVFDLHFNPNDGWIRPLARRALSSLYETFGEHFGEERSDQRLLELAGAICLNTAQPIADAVSEANSWMNQLTGPNLRWETLGILFTYWNFGAQNGRANEKTKASMEKLRDASRQCIGYCLELFRAVSNVGNPILLYLSYKRVIIESTASGDASLTCWQYHAETVALMTFMGIHAESGTEAYIPNLTSEIRRTLFAYIFNIDKVIACFCGRPPLISRRYASTPLLLDLGENGLLSGQIGFNAAVNALDEKGWNKKNALYSTTVLRARVMLAFIRDEILEIALGNGERASIQTLLSVIQIYTLA